MNEGDIRLVKRIVREEIAEILDTEVWDAILEFVNGQEAGISAFKQRIGVKKGVVTVPETTFDILNFEAQEGARIGAYEVAYEKNNIPEKFTHAYNILNKNNATISNRYHGEGYKFSYWLYGEDRIFRQRLKV